MAGHIRNVTRSTSTSAEEEREYHRSRILKPKKGNPTSALNPAATAPETNMPIHGVMFHRFSRVAVTNAPRPTYAPAARSNCPPMPPMMFHAVASTA